MEEGWRRSSSSSSELCNVPEDCIYRILSRTSVRDVCRLSVLSRQFLAAATADAVWTCFLPPAHQRQAILAASSVPLQYASLKQLYFQLCNSVPVDNSTKRIWIERSTGKIGHVLSATTFYVTWGDDNRYWQWQRRQDSSFGVSAVLLGVWWLDFGGRMDCKMLSPDTTYRVSFVLKFADRWFGWNTNPVKLWLKLPDGQVFERELLLEQWRREVGIHDGWYDLVVGQFMAERDWHLADDDALVANANPAFVEFGMHEKLCNRCKSGLILEGVKFQPLGTAF